jgi:hypothetical protein
MAYYIKGIGDNNSVHIFDGCHNPYPISIDNPPRGYSYTKKDALNKMNYISKNTFIKIKWSIITKEQFIKLRIKWCEDYIKQYK